MSMEGGTMEGVNTTKVLEMNGITHFSNRIICYQPSSITTNGLWQKQDPLNYSLPLFILQLMIIVSITKVTIIILKPLRQPRIVSEILGAFLLGSYALGNIGWIGRNIFPLKGMMVLETMGSIGFYYYLFLMGVEMDVSLIKRTSRQTLVIAAFGLFVPFITYTSLTTILHITVYGIEVLPVNIIYQGVTISFTAFPVVSRILVELKLFNTELGKQAMSAALVVDLFAWVSTTIFARLANDVLYDFYVVILGTIGLVLSCVFFIRPAIIWISNCAPERENFNEFYVCLILTGIMISTFIGDIFGSASFGAFVFGLVVPNGPLGTALLEKLEDFITTILLPITFTTTNFRVDLNSSNKHLQSRSMPLEFGVLFLTNLSKVLSTFLAGLYYDMQMHEALSLGLLMNTKGVINLTFFFVGLRTKVFDDYTFSINLIFMVVVMAITTPAIAALYNTSRGFISYKLRSIQMVDMNTDLKIFTCVHTPRNASAMINLLEVSYANKVSPIDAYTIHLVELTGRASSMLIVHNARKNRHSSDADHSSQSEQIIKAFENYAQHATNVYVQPLTAISSYTTMHEDICNLAGDKRAAVIILPFHKQQTVDGDMDFINPAFQQLNQNVLANAPCSVGIFIDRGLGGFASHHIVVIFIGGPDDREALAYGWRMAQHSSVNLIVIRFLPGDDITKHSEKQQRDLKTLNVDTQMKWETQLDNEYIGDFRLKIVGYSTVMYKEIVVKTAEEMVSTIRNMDNMHDLYIVGSGRGIVSPLTVGLNEYSDNPELGAIGDLLASAPFASTISILVMQQYAGEKT